MQFSRLSLGVSIHRTELIKSYVSALRGPQKLPMDLGTYDEVTDRVEDGLDQSKIVYGRVFAEAFQPYYIDLTGLWGEAAVLVGVQNVNSRTGKPGFLRLEQRPQNYYLRPDDPYVDGWTKPDKPGVVGQFIFVSEGSDLEVAQYVLPDCLVGDKISIAVFRPDLSRNQHAGSKGGKVRGESLGVGHAGDIQQSHAVDGRGLWYWKDQPSVTFVYTIVNRPPERRPQPRRDDGFLHGVPPAA